jgi:hypothetical protein
LEFDALEVNKTPPILFVVFNRPDTTFEVFDSIRRSKPDRLYIAADGPRPNRETEAMLCEQVRSIVSDVDWPCELKTLFRKDNLGCKTAVSGAIEWFFSHESEGIILEDDCLPHPDFYRFCAQMLEYYRHDESVGMITGNNFQNGQIHGDASYYFSKYSHIWGWACWRRSWVHYDGDLSFWKKWKKSAQFQSLFVSAAERRYWQRAFTKSDRNRIDSWAYPWMASLWHEGALTVTPNENLVTNIGFGEAATHTVDADSVLSVPYAPLGELVHASTVFLSKEADAYVFERVFKESFGSLLRRAPAIIRKILRQFFSENFSPRRSKA